mmetsp:Transcript_26055/g.71680  ORF Transcript_26055/g.71680 Transcript_26055/m.71680 type:complete len:208 (+) Transcript_26055:89-712(+)
MTSEKSTFLPWSSTTPLLISSTPCEKSSAVLLSRMASRTSVRSPFASWRPWRIWELSIWATFLLASTALMIEELSIFTVPAFIAFTTEATPSSTRVCTWCTFLMPKSISSWLCLSSLTICLISPTFCEQSKADLLLSIASKTGVKSTRRSSPILRSSSRSSRSSVSDARWSRAACSRSGARAAAWAELHRATQASSVSPSVEISSCI